MEEDCWIPRTLDDPKLLFIWEMDCAMIFISLTLLGILVDMFELGILLAYLLTKGYARLKEEGGKGLIVKILYWFFPSEMSVGKKHLPSNVREYIG